MRKNIDLLRIPRDFVRLPNLRTREFDLSSVIAKFADKGLQYFQHGIQKLLIVLPAADVFRMDWLGDRFLGGGTHQFCLRVAMEIENTIVPW